MLLTEFDLQRIGVAVIPRLPVGWLRQFDGAHADDILFRRRTEWADAIDCQQFFASVADQLMSVFAKCVQADSLKEGDGRGNGNQWCWISRAQPVGSILPEWSVSRDGSSPADDRALDFVVMFWVDPQKAAAKRSTQPLMTTGTVIVAPDIVQMQVQHRDCMRAINGG